jgi:hypothetical protein
MDSACACICPRDRNSLCFEYGGGPDSATLVDCE